MTSEPSHCDLEDILIWVQVSPFPLKHILPEYNCFIRYALLQGCNIKICLGNYMLW